MNHSETETRIPGTIGDKEANKLESGLYAIRNLAEALRLIGRLDDIESEVALAIFGIADSIDEKAKEVFDLVSKIACEPYEEKETQRSAA